MFGKLLDSVNESIRKSFCVVAEDTASNQQKTVGYFDSQEEAVASAKILSKDLLVEQGKISVYKGIDVDLPEAQELVWSSSMIEARGDGIGVGGSRQGDGGADSCVCPNCGAEYPHAKGAPCAQATCAECGTALKGVDSKSEGYSEFEEGKVPSTDDKEDVKIKKLTEQDVQNAKDAGKKKLAEEDDDGKKEYSATDIHKLAAPYREEALDIRERVLSLAHAFDNIHSSLSMLVTSKDDTFSREDILGLTGKVRKLTLDAKDTAENIVTSIEDFYDDIGYLNTTQ